MDKDNPKQPNPLQNFTNAVKTIVNVPKDTVSPKPGTYKRDRKYEERTCPDCGKHIVRRDKHDHEK